jgi:hypothetical protein
MASEMTSFVKVKNANKEVYQKLKEIFTPSEGKYDVNSIELINRVWGTNYSYREENENWDEEKDWPSWEEWDKLLGPKWCNGEEFYMDEEDDEGSFILRAAYSVPQVLLEKIAKILSEIKEDCYLVGNYEHEDYDPVGAFLYAKDWDDIEDLDSGYDSEDLWEDDELRDEMWDEVNELETDIERAYFEYLEDKKNNPQDYE